MTAMGDAGEPVFGRREPARTQPTPDGRAHWGETKCRHARVFGMPSVDRSAAIALAANFLRAEPAQSASENETCNRFHDEAYRCDKAQQAAGTGETRQIVGKLAACA